MAYTSIIILYNTLYNYCLFSWLPSLLEYKFREGNDFVYIADCLISVPTNVSGTWWRFNIYLLNKWMNEHTLRLTQRTAHPGMIMLEVLLLDYVKHFSDY